MSSQIRDKLNFTEEGTLTNLDREFLTSFLSNIHQIQLGNFEYVLKEITDYITSREFLGTDADFLFDLQRRYYSALSRSDYDMHRSLQSSKRALLIIEIVFAHKQFKKIWDTINASKISKIIPLFEYEIKRVVIKEEMSIRNYFEDIHRILENIFKFNLDYFEVPNSPENTLVSEKFMSMMGTIMILRQTGIVTFENKSTIEFFKTSGLNTFFNELERSLNEALMNNSHLLDFVNQDLNPGGVLFKLMRISLPDLFENFLKNDKRDYHSTATMLEENDFQSGICPAARNIEGESIRIVDKLAEVIITNMPKHLLN